MPLAFLDGLDRAPAPLAVLVVALAITAAVSLVGVVVTELARSLVDRRWSPNQPLNPTELLWAEAGAHVQRTFKGLDLTLARELATQMVERKLKAGTFLFHQGDVATHFYVLAKGKVEAVEEAPDRVLRAYAPGESFGEVAILQRTARTASVRAVTDSVVLALAAEDFVAAATLSAAEGADFSSVVAAYLAADQSRSPDVAAPAAPAPAPAAPDGWHASHLVPAGGLPTWPSPDREGPPAATLAARTEVMVAGIDGTSARVLLADGSAGWVDRRLLIPHRTPRSSA